MVITLPKDVETVELMESLSSDGYASANTRFGFDTEIFTPKSSEYISKKGDIVQQLRNLYELINLLKEEDKKSYHKSIYKIQMDREEKSEQRRVFSKIFKLDENNQDGLAVAKPLLIEIFNKKPSVTLELMNKIVEN